MQAMKLRIDMQDSAEMLAYRWRIVPKGEKERLFSAAQDHLHLHYGELLIGDFLLCMSGDFGCIDVASGDDWCMATNAQYLWAMGFSPFAKSFAKMMGRLTVPPTPDEQRAQQYCVKMTLAESVLVFAREYYGLPSLHDAERLTVNELVIAKKDAYNKAITQRKLAELMRVKR